MCFRGRRVRRPENCPGHGFGRHFNRRMRVCQTSYILYKSWKSARAEAGHSARCRQGTAKISHISCENLSLDEGTLEIQYFLHVDAMDQLLDTRLRSAWRSQRAFNRKGRIRT
ncbi:hypothetical protein BGLA2_2070007 [Burkholderia gladioli]|nr:hypothetical protein BGLA2_2070007 [Burkholderia gladioli]